MILEGKFTKNGSQIKGDAIMLGKYDDVIPCIDNAYHPNPGSDYSEIERCIDWTLTNNLEERVLKYIEGWMTARVNNVKEYFGTDDFDEFVKEVMFSDDYTPCTKTIDLIKKCMKSDSDNKNEKPYAERIARFINDNFTRVRAGGKLNPDGSDSIYFRISSHGYDWREVFVDFLWDTFGSPDKMPRRIWIGHDAENNPPEVTLFDGTPEELFDTTRKMESKDYERPWI